MNELTPLSAEAAAAAAGRPGGRAPRRRGVGIGLALLASVGMLAAMVAWASQAELSTVSRARAQVIASARTQVIQAAVDGLVAEVLVGEGDVVRRGQTLVRLDRGEAEAAWSDSRSKVAALKASLVRLQAEVLGVPLAFDASLREYPEFVANQRRLYQRRHDALDAELTTYARALALAREELAMTRKLAATGDVGRADVLRLERQEVELQGQIDSRRSKFLQEAQEAMTKAEEDLATQQQLLAERRLMLDRTTIEAPTDGIVRNIQVTTLGARVRPGEVILDLLPTDGPLVVEARLSPTDIAFVRTGTPAAVKLDAFDYSIYGSIRGHAAYVSPDALKERGPTGEETYYRVLVEVDPASVKERSARHPDRPLQVLPGMQATVEFVVGEQTVLQYLAKPLVKTLDMAMKER